MAISILDLEKKYGREDSTWSFGGLVSWLEKKGIPNTSDMPIVGKVLQEILIEFDIEDLPDSHHDFDYMVLARCEQMKKTISEMAINVLQSNVDEALRKYDEDWYKLGKIRKIWRVLWGKD